MKICIKENEFNPSFIGLYGEKKAIEQGYSIIEVQQGYEDCSFDDFDKNGFNIELYNKRKQSYKSQNKIAELKQKLANTDYKAIKYAEGVLTKEEYEPIKKERQALRDKINQLEQK